MNDLQQSFDFTRPLPFSGKTFEAQFDASRLIGQYQRVWAAMADGEWRTLSQIQTMIQYWYEKYDSEAAISARLRDFRKEKWGKHTVERRRKGEPSSGLFEYRLIVAK